MWVSWRAKDEAVVGELVERLLQRGVCHGVGCDEAAILRFVLTAGWVVGFTFAAGVESGKNFIRGQFEDVPSVRCSTAEPFNAKRGIERIFLVGFGFRRLASFFLGLFRCCGIAGGLQGVGGAFTDLVAPREDLAEREGFSVMPFSFRAAPQYIVRLVTVYCRQIRPEELHALALNELLHGVKNEGFFRIRVHEHGFEVIRWATCGFIVSVPWLCMSFLAFSSFSVSTSLSSVSVLAQRRFPSYPRL